MIRGLYTAGTAMLSNMKKMDVVTNNLANANTTGFKEDNLVTRSFDEILIERTNDSSVVFASNEVGPLGKGIHVDSVYTKFQQGLLNQTGVKTDFLIEGEGFFVVGTENGDRYTRDGAFFINKDRILVNDTGYPIMGENGEIYLDNDNFEVRENGEIYIEGELINKIKLLNFNVENMRKEGNNLYYSVSEGFDTDASIMQGYLENSNVDIAKSLVDMIKIYRNYESNQRIIKMLDETLGKAVNEIGKIWIRSEVNDTSIT